MPLIGAHDEGEEEGGGEGEGEAGIAKQSAMMTKWVQLAALYEEESEYTHCCKSSSYNLQYYLSDSMLLPKAKNWIWQVIRFC